jgi:phytoene dehydrogenase-like protein
MTRKACIVGAGPNGLAAAIVLAQAGLDVEVFEAEPQPGGAARTLELTVPGFLHDFGSAVHRCRVTFFLNAAAVALRPRVDSFSVNASAPAG